MSSDAVFSALADGTRRSLFEEVSRRGAATPTELAAAAPVTRQAVTKHLQALEGAGLVAASREGRETRYRPTPRPLGDAIEWMVAVGGEWDERLGALERSAARRRGR
ncbi:MAG TPA: metalloregulator ArsR/SmtB family transcription factor [Solirubrobacteraceae bacterium]